MRPKDRNALTSAREGPAVVRALPVARDDTALVAGLVAGEGWARAAFFERHAPPVERVLRKILGPRHASELADLVHDVFVEALTSLERLRDPQALMAFMLAIAAHRASRLIRAQRARRWLVFWDRSDVPEPAVDDIDPEVVEAYRRTYALLDRLPARERVAFALRYIDGMPLAEVAAACRVSLATIKRTLERAERRFAAGARNDDVLRTWLEEGGRWTD